MVFRNGIGYACRAALLIALAFAAAAQTVEEGKRLYAEGRYADARRVFAGLRSQMEPTQAGSGLLEAVLDGEGLSEQSLGHWVEAESLLRRAVNISHTPVVETHLAELYLEERRPRDAEPVLRHAVATQESQENPDWVALAVSRNDLAILRAMEGNFREAERRFGETLRLLENQLGPDHPMLTSSLNPLVGMLIAQHRYRDAVAPAERAWRIMQAATSRIAKPDSASTLVALAMVYSRTGRAREAESCARQALTWAESIYGPDCPRLAGFLTSYAAILKQSGRKKDAKPLEKHARALLAQTALDNQTLHTVSASALR